MEINTPQIVNLDAANISISGIEEASISKASYPIFIKGYRDPHKIIGISGSMILLNNFVILLFLNVIVCIFSRLADAFHVSSRGAWETMRRKRVKSAFDMRQDIVFFALFAIISAVSFS